ncbi:MAG: GMC family oxidoreductase [Deltaproteobacteria bacterium]|nr:GMC family oxidoreductase [Deltaproteobacteria bacterium]
MDRQKLFISLLEAFIQKPGIPDSVKKKSIVQLETYLKDAPVIAKFGFSFLLYLVEYLPLFSRGTRLSRMDIDTRAGYIGGFSGRIGANILMVLKLFVTLSYYSVDEIERQLGFTRHCEDIKGRVKKPVFMDGSAADRDVTIDADVCVIGTGAGGAAVAYTVAKAGMKAVVLEEGRYLTGEDFTQRPVDAFTSLYRDQGFITSIGTPPIIIPLGRSVGGTTTINSGTCYRLPTSVIKSWREQYGIAWLTDEEYARLASSVEKEVHVEPVPERIFGNNSGLFRKGTESLGLAGAPIPRNAYECDGCAFCAFGCPRDAKYGTMLNYVPDAIKHGAVLCASTKAVRLIVSRGRVEGVSGVFLDVHGKPLSKHITVKAKHVVVSAGAIYTPVFLKKSGLRHPRIGRNLHIHPAARVSAMFDERMDGWVGVPQGYNVHHYVDEGIFIQGQFVPPSILSQSIPFTGSRHTTLMDRYAYMGSFGALISDTGSGRVSPGLGSPLISYTLSKEDHVRMVKAIAITAKVWFAAGATEVHTQIATKPVIHGPKEADELMEELPPAWSLELMAFHPMGTAMMGGDERTAVVKPDGETYEVKGLYVADASLFPTSTRLNPQITIMSVATKVGEEIGK